MTDKSKPTVEDFFDDGRSWPKMCDECGCEKWILKHIDAHTLLWRADGNYPPYLSPSITFSCGHRYGMKSNGEWEKSK